MFTRCAMSHGRCRARMSVRQMAEVLELFDSRRELKRPCIRHHPRDDFELSMWRPHGHVMPSMSIRTTGDLFIEASADLSSQEAAVELSRTPPGSYREDCGTRSSGIQVAPSALTLASMKLQRVSLATAAGGLARSAPPLRLAPQADVVTGVISTARSPSRMGPASAAAGWPRWGGINRSPGVVEASWCHRATAVGGQHPHPDLRSHSQRGGRRHQSVDEGPLDGGPVDAGHNAPLMP